MKNLMAKCALLLFIVGVLLHVGGIAYRKTTAYQNLERTEGTDIYPSMPESIDIAVFGPSHGREDFQYPPEGYSYFNFSLSSQTPQYDAAMLRQYQDRISPGALIVLTVSPLSPYWTDSASEFQAKQSRYYRILQAKNIVDVDLPKYGLERVSPLLTQNLENWLSAFTDPPELQPTANESYRLNQLSPDSIPGEQERVKTFHLRLITPDFPGVNPVMWDSYHEILSMCEEHGWNAVFVSPPYLSEYMDCYPEGFYEEFHNRVQALSEEAGILYLDYSHSPEYYGHYELFMDIDHLNLNGAAKFNQQFFSDAKSKGLL